MIKVVLNSLLKKQELSQILLVSIECLNYIFGTVLKPILIMRTFIMFVFFFREYVQLIDYD